MVLRRSLGAMIGFALFSSSLVAQALPPGPLDAASRATLAGIVADPPPAKLIQGQHYFISNEVYPERFRTALADLGGIVVGVGPEQSYFYAGWAKPEVLILMDFDELIVDLHGVYRAFFLAAPDAGAFVALWNDPVQAKPALAAAAGSPAELAKLEYAYKVGRRYVYERMRQGRKRYGQFKIATFLTDEAQYNTLVALASEGRMVAVHGDLTGKRTMNGIAEAARALALPVRALYLSNVEQYFDYQSGLAANLSAQPVDDKSIVLRTFFRHDDDDDHYRYYVQSSTGMRAWLGLGTVRNLAGMLAQARPFKQGDAWMVPEPR